MTHSKADANVTRICASCNRSSRLDVRRTRNPLAAPAAARFEPTKKEPGSLVLTPNGFVMVKSNGDTTAFDGEVS